MSRLRLTKNALRDQQRRLQQLEKYLPTLQLKKSLLQIEVQNTQARIARKQKQLEEIKQLLHECAACFVEDVDYDFSQLAQIRCVQKEYENVAGVEIPIFQDVQFVKDTTHLFATPSWFNSALHMLRKAIVFREDIAVCEEQKRCLQQELHEVSIRVNLFEKVLIPRHCKNVQKIRIFLGDQELAAVAQAKVAKQKIEEKKKAL